MICISKPLPITMEELCGQEPMLPRDTKFSNENGKHKKPEPWGMSLQFDVADSDFNVPDLLFGSEYYLVVDSDDDGDLSDETPTALTNTSGDLWSASVDFADNAIFFYTRDRRKFHQSTISILGNSIR